MAEYKPTDQQQLILRHDPHRHARIQAGPGAGKSATIVSYLAELQKSGAALKVKLLTFSRKATAELIGKVSSQSITVAERPSTFHSFAISVLMMNPGAGNFPKPMRIADDADMSDAVIPILQERSGFKKKELKSHFTEMAANWDTLDGRPLNPDITDEDRRRFRSAWNETRRVLGYTSLAELPFALKRALENHDTLKGTNFDLLIVDEYQDLNACDLAVLKLLSERGTAVVVAGDDDQSIYGKTRHASPAGIRRFTADYPNAADYPLTIALRCGKKSFNGPQRLLARILIEAHQNPQ